MFAIAVGVSPQLSQHSLCSFNVCVTLTVYLTYRILIRSRKLRWVLPSRLSQGRPHTLVITRVGASQSLFFELQIVDCPPFFMSGAPSYVSEFSEIRFLSIGISNANTVCLYAACNKACLYMKIDRTNPAGVVRRIERSPLNL